MRDGQETGMYTGALVGRAPIGEPSAAADSARRVNIKDRERTILVFEVGANKQSAIRHMSRRELLEEARRASTPLRLQRADGPAARLGADAVLKARDVRKVDPLFAGRLEPVILVRCGSITVSLGRTELRAIILHDRLYFIVPDGADSMLQEVHRNLLLVLHGSLAGDSGGAARSEPPSTEHSPHPARHDGGPIAPARAAGTPPPYTPPPLSSVATGGFGADSGAPPPFEFAALEAVLMIACSDLHKRQEELGSLVRCALLELRRTVVGSRVVAGSKQLEAVRELAQEGAAHSIRITALDRAIDACLDDDEDMETLAKFSSATPMQTPPPHTPLPAGSLRQVGRSASLLSDGGAEGDEEARG
ncbi:hypothetical protein EMIHUDRAFT_450951 [Emiliania huxleyi CCMP1516]|uniref:Uncharacterized protein n=2 Tax=Emiliania huxleyi TaxID=2903 RepID=A0A0D3JAF1_EMIH1|nr:hypothetical protein EMIHUDRAFT_450951 [Emiliania huxleyi CCMP1516]EOD20486.1 hypothetical protein EMIHUDRAFT_450951 [Emiliania huxleyi CCMP1516]|eukprot:XP_005772915.1 hypothetical protein EMIHUDRAFT_450951 [Emiliania huxleyi CCMP1516]